MPPPASLQPGAPKPGVSHGMYTKDKDGNKVPIEPPITESDYELEDNPGVRFEKKVGDMVFECAKNKKGKFIEVGRRIEDEDGKVKMRLKIEKKDA